MSCNANTKQCIIPENSLLPECCKNNLLELLSIIDTVFTEHNIIYWLDYGTLLGAVRNKDIIKYDTDCDIGVLRQDMDKILSLSDEFRLKGYHLVSWFYPNFLRLDFSRINELHVDIFFWNIKRMPFKQLWENENQYSEFVCLDRQFYIQGKDETKGRHFPLSYLFPMQKIQLNNKLYWCSNNPQQFCKFRYGLTWDQEIRE